MSFIKKINTICAEKKRLTPEAKKLVEKYRFYNRELDRYQGSVFYTGNPNDSRCKEYESAQKEIADKLEKLGYKIDECY